MRFHPAIWKILTGTPQLPAIEPSSKLRQNFSWTLVGNVIYAACQWGILVVLTKLGTPETVGQFTLGLAITSPIMVFANLHLRAVQATDVKQQYRFSDYLQLRIVMITIALLMVIGLVVHRSDHSETVWVILLVGLAKAIESLSDIFYGLLQQREQMRPISLSMILRGVLSLVALGSVMYVTRSIVWGTAAYAMAWAIVFTVYDSRKVASESASLSRTWNLPTLTKLAQGALPLGLVMMLISLNVNIPRYFIEHNFGQRELGIFAAMAYLQVAGTTLVTSLGQAASPRLARYYAQGNRSAFQRLLAQLMVIGGGLGCAGVLIAWIAGKPILTLLYRSEYAEHIDVFLWLMVGAGIGYVASFLGYGMTAARYFRSQFVMFFGVTVIVALMSVWLIPNYALQGSAWVFVISSIAQLVGSAIIMVHICHQLEKEAVYP